MSTTSPQPLVYGIHARNPLAAALDDYEISHTLPDGVELLSTEPKAQVRERLLVWRFRQFPPGGAQQIFVTVRPPSKHWQPPTAAEFHIHFRNRSTFRAPLTRPAIEITLPPTVDLIAGRTMSFPVRLTNRGLAPLVGGLLRGEGIRDAEQKVPQLAPGAQTIIDVAVKADQPGDHLVKLTVLEGGLPRPVSAQVACQVQLEPLLILWSGPARLPAGSALHTTITVRNTTATTFADVQVTLLCAEGVQAALVTGQKMGTLQEALSWGLSNFKPGAEATFPVAVLAQVPGECQLAIQAMSGTTETLFTWTGPALISKPARVLDSLIAALDRQITGSAPTTEAPAAAPRYVVFRLGDEDFGFPLAAVQEIARPVPITPVPNTPDWLVGVGNVRGDVVSMVDLRQFLGMTRNAAEAERLLVVQSKTDDLVVGLLVDNVRGLTSIIPENIRQPATPLEGRIPALLAGLAEVDGHLLGVLAAERLLHAPELRQLQAV
jgi:purine-binding chemotaxis protein CheW